MRSLMQTKSWLAIRILLNRFHAKTAKEFLSLLPPEDLQQLVSQDVTTSEIDPFFVKTQDFFKNIHYSWLLPSIQSLPKHIQELLISSLPPTLSASLKKHLKIMSPLIRIPPRAGAFFVRKLYEQIHEPDILDPSFLPKENLSILLDLSQKEMMEVIDFLGLYDLAESMRNIVDKKSLQIVYTCLDHKKLQFLRMCLHHKSKIAAPKLDLQKWGTECEEFLKTLHQRGLYRLGKALSGSNPSLLWHLTHRLDTGRSALIEKYCSKQANPGITTPLSQQVMNVMNFLKHKSGL